MQLKVDQLDSHLRRGPAASYLVSGDEPLQSAEAADAIRRAARSAGFAEREILEQGSGFDWQSLSATACSMSLFATRRLIELRLASSKIGVAGGTALTDYVRQPPPDTMLLVICPKVERSQRNSRWVKALSDVGVWLEVWPKEGAELLRWIELRLRSKGFQADRDGAAFLAQQVEGNLLAADQEIRKLSLLFASGRLATEQLVQAVADNARFDVYGWVDAGLAGNARRIQRMLRVLRGEGVPAALVLWALAREVRSLCKMSARLTAGEDLERTLTANRVWDRRRPIIRQCLKNYPLGHWRSLLQGCARVDRMIKGRCPGGEPWGALDLLGLQLAGVRTMLDTGGGRPGRAPLDYRG